MKKTILALMISASLGICAEEASKIQGFEAQKSIEEQLDNALNSNKELGQKQKQDIKLQIQRYLGE